MIEEQGAAAIHGSLVERGSDQKFFFKKDLFILTAEKKCGKNDILCFIFCFRDY